MVPTLDQARRIIWAVRDLDYMPANADRGRILFAFFCVMLYCGLRPAEAVALKVDNCHLPVRGWGKLTLTSSAPEVGELWTDDGQRYEQRGLKHRDPKAVRVVPIPPDLVKILRLHLMDFAPAADWWLFYDGPDHAFLKGQMYRRVWDRARKAALSGAEYASPLARRVYTLRHFNASTLLQAGLDTADVARRLGHSIQTLLTIYAHWIDTGEERANALIDAVLARETRPFNALTSTNEPGSRGPATGQPAAELRATA
ncbi:site-specific integrase [Nonomuraea sediminis]|uniref:site-specific integrase n=1 Tax=Nonomuraea sediminis TaxID=2835864 RepID=UPI001BDDA32E|nr:site-specific integrase [Nonomuraea sediminis]